MVCKTWRNQNKTTVGDAKINSELTLPPCKALIGCQRAENVMPIQH
jgi:hypothetical protein